MLQQEKMTCQVSLDWIPTESTTPGHKCVVGYTVHTNWFERQAFLHVFQARTRKLVLIFQVLSDHAETTWKTKWVGSQTQPLFTNPFPASWLSFEPLRIVSVVAGSFSVLHRAACQQAFTGN